MTISCTARNAICATAASFDARSRATSRCSDGFEMTSLSDSIAAVEIDRLVVAHPADDVAHVAEQQLRHRLALLDLLARLAVGEMPATSRLMLSAAR